MQQAFQMLFPFLLVPGWFGALWSAAQLSGWAKLAAKYRCDEDASVESWKGWRWGKFGIASYKRCLWIAVTPKGLHIKTGPLFLFRPFHPPLLIPWSKIRSVEESSYWWLRTIKIRLTDFDKEIMLERRILDDAQRFLGDKLNPSH